MDQGDRNQEAFFRAVETGDLREVAGLLDEEPDLIGAWFREGDPEETEEETALHLAASVGHADMVRLLLERGADPNLGSPESGLTPLHLVEGEGAAEAALLLLEAGADAKARDEGEATPLHLAADRGDDEVVRRLLQAGVDPDPRDEEGTTPLLCAVEADSLEVVRRLLQAGADPNRARDDGENAWSTALSWEAGDEILELLREHGAEPPAELTADDVAEGVTPLLSTVLQAVYAVTEPMEWLLEGQEDPEGALAERAEKRRRRIEAAARPLLEQGVEIDLMAAAVLGDVDRLRELLEEDPEAARSGLDSEGGPPFTEEGSLTPMHLAAWTGRTEAVRLLLDHGAPCDLYDPNGATPLQRAVEWGFVDTARALLEGGASVDRGDRYDGSPLHPAAARGHAIMVRLLLEHGADPGSEDEQGDTPLHHAAKGGHEGAVRALLEGGADHAAQGMMGMTAARLAEGDSPALAELIRGWERSS